MGGKPAILLAGFLDTGFRRYDEFAASGGEYNPKGLNPWDKAMNPSGSESPRFQRKTNILSFLGSE